MKKAAAFLLAVCLLSGTAFAETPESMREQCRNKVKIADQFVADAQKTLSSGQTSENMMASLKLYIKAEEMYEQAASIMNTMKAGVFTQDETARCNNSMRNCLQEIKNLKHSLELE